MRRAPCLTAAARVDPESLFLQIIISYVDGGLGFPARVIRQQRKPRRQLRRKWCIRENIDDSAVFVAASAKHDLA